MTSGGGGGSIIGPYVMILVVSCKRIRVDGRWLWRHIITLNHAMTGQGAHSHTLWSSAEATIFYYSPGARLQVSSSSLRAPSLKRSIQLYARMKINHYFRGLSVGIGSKDGLEISGRSIWSRELCASWWTKPCPSPAANDMRVIRRAPLTLYFINHALIACFNFFFSLSLSLLFCVVVFATVC
jgi:hypothetical protein